MVPSTSRCLRSAPQILSGPMSIWALKAPFAASALSAITACSCQFTGVSSTSHATSGDSQSRVLSLSRTSSSGLLRPESRPKSSRSKRSVPIGGVELSLCNLQLLLTPTGLLMETQSTFLGASNFQFARHPTTQRMLRNRQKERLLARAGAMETTATTLRRQAQAKLNLSHGAGAGNSVCRDRTEIRIRRSETD